MIYEIKCLQQKTEQLQKTTEYLQSNIERLQKTNEGLLSAIERLSNQFKAPSHQDDDLVEIETTSKIIFKSVNTIYNLCSQHKIPYMKKGRKLYFSRTSLKEWIHSGNQKTNEEIANEIQLKRRVKCHN